MKKKKVLSPKQKKLDYSFLAGLIDGDGSIRVYKTTGELVVTMHREDLPFLEQLQNQLGGDLRRVKDKNAIRLLLNSKNAKEGKETLKLLVEGLNGNIRNTIRIDQFKRLCNAFQIEYLPPVPLDNNSGYIAGLFCSDGSIYLNCRPSSETRQKKKLSQVSSKGGRILEKKSLSDPEVLENRIQRVLKGISPRIQLKIVNKFLINIEDLPLCLGYGQNYFDRGSKRAPDGHHFFLIQKEEEVLQFFEYMNRFRSCSTKHKRLDLIPVFCRLKKEKAHLQLIGQPGSILWEQFVRKWYG